MEEFKSGFVSIIGRTNVGKSTLLNTLVKEKVAIMTSKPQTTRTAIKAIVNKPNSQIIFIDTPGIHKPKNKFGNVLVETAFGTISEVDVVLFVIEANSLQPGRGDKLILEKIKEKKLKTILVINKIDMIPKQNLLQIIENYTKLYHFEAVVPVSASKQKGIEELLLEIEKQLPKGPKYYAEEEYTDQTARQMVAETIREKALKLLNDEVPHGIYIEIEKMILKKTMQKETIYHIDATIYCIKNSHKGIIIGKNGSMLKKIGTYARQDLENILQTKVNLQLWVKVSQDWQDNEKTIQKFKMTDKK